MPTDDSLPRFGWQKRALAAEPTTDEETLVRLFAAGPSNSVLRALGKNTNTPPEVLSKLALTPNMKVRTAAAGNANTPLAVLAVLTHHPAQELREAATKNPTTIAYRSSDILSDSPLRDTGSPQTLENAISILFEDGGVEMASRIRDFRSTWPSEALAAFAHSSIAKVREEVAHHRNADIQTLDYLAKSSTRAVQSAVANNQNASAATLKYLGSLVEGVRLYSFTMDVHFIGQAVARNPRTLPETLSTLARHGSRRIREEVARNKRTPSGILSMLADDGSIAVVERVAENPNTPPGALASLVRMALKIDEDLRAIPIRSTRYREPGPTDPEAIIDLGGSWSTVLFNAARNTGASPETLSALAEAGYEEEVARNSSAPPELRTCY